MKFKLITFAIAVASLLFLGCTPGMTAEEKKQNLEAERAQIFADLHRQRAECQAQAIEFNGERRIVESCIATYEAMADAADKTIAVIDKRIAEIERTGK